MNENDTSNPKLDANAHGVDGNGNTSICQVLEEQSSTIDAPASATLPDCGALPKVAVAAPAANIILPPLNAATLDVRKKQLNLTILRLIGAWVGVLLLLTVIGLLANLEWARPKVEQSMEQSFHRHVKLGRISWMLGLNGLSIWTDKLVMTESDGQPFVVSGESEIGIAFIPLLHKRVIIKHLEFHHPEVFARQITPGRWNFTDMLVEGPEIHYVEVDDGVLHLRNELTDSQLKQTRVHDSFANTAWRSYDFQSVSIKLVFPQKNQTHPWPFYLAFHLPRTEGDRKYTSNVSLTLLCKGPFEKWQQHPCEIDLRADQINPDDWRPFFQFPDGVKTLFACKFNGKGKVSDTISGVLSGSAENIKIATEQQTLFAAPEASWTADLSLSGKEIKWDNLDVLVAGIKIQSHGSVIDWRNADPKYFAVMNADLRNLAQLSDTSFWKLLPGADGHKQAPELSGAAQVEITMEGDNSTKSISTKLMANGVPLGNLLSGDSKDGVPFLSLFKIKPNAPIQGQILIGRDQTISLNDVSIPANGSTLDIHGVINAAKHTHDVEITSKDLVLDNFDTARLEEGQSPSILLSGKIDLAAHLISEEKGQHIAVLARLKGSSVSAGKATLARNLSGTIDFDGSSLKFDKVSGVIDNKNGSRGNITLNGYLDTVNNGHCGLTISGHGVDIDQLESFCHSAHLPMPESVVDKWSGTARDILIGVSGKAGAPEFVLRLTPEDVTYSMTPPKGAVLKPLKVTGGLIVVASDKLELKDLPVTGQTGKILLSALFTGSGDQLALRNIHVKSTAIGIEEVQQYLSSPDLPPQTRSAFSNVVGPLQLCAVQGKTSGDLKMTVPSSSSGVCTLDGTLGFTNLSGKYFQQHIPFDRLSGVIACSANQLALQDISVMSGNSHFMINGEVTNIQKSPLWNLQVSSQFKSDDILVWLPPDLAQGIKASSKGTMSLHATVSGDNQLDRVVFAAQAYPGCGLQMHGPGWSFVQPSSTPITADGTLVLRNGILNSLQVEGVHFAIAESSFQTSGKYEWSQDAKQPAAMELVVTTPAPVPAALLVSTFFPDVDTVGAGGTIKGTLAFAGTQDRLLTHGDFVLSSVSLPAFNMKNVNGKIHSPRWSLIGIGNDGAMKSQVQIQIASANLGGIPLRSLSGTVLLENGKDPRLTLSDGLANLAGGQVTLAGFFLPNNQKWHLDLAMSQLQIDEFVTDLIERSGEVTGLADGHISLESSGTTYSDIISGLNGSGEINVGKGTVPKVAQLQEKLSQANLIQQGIFGFNLNNVLRTVLPVKAGKFREASCSFQVTDGVVVIDRLNFVGNDLRLRAAGNWNMPQNTVNVEVAGNIPRVASSILPGAVGEVSRNLTIQKAVRVVTFHKLESLPSVPILGDIGTDDPRAFTFKVSCPLSAVNAMQNSISKSFRWLPNKPNASAHPVPGISAAGLSL